MAKRKSFRDDEDAELDEERDERDEEDEDEEEEEVPALLDEPLTNPFDRQVYINCFCALLTAERMKKTGKIDFEKVADDAEDAFYAGIARIGGRAPPRR